MEIKKKLIFPCVLFNSAFRFQGLFFLTVLLVLLFLFFPILCSIPHPAKVIWHVSFHIVLCHVSFNHCLLHTHKKRHHILPHCSASCFISSFTQFYYLFLSISHLTCSWAPYHGCSLLRQVKTLMAIFQMVEFIHDILLAPLAHSQLILTEWEGKDAQVIHLLLNHIESNR